MTDKLRLVIDIEGVTDDQVLEASPFRLTGQHGFDVAAEGVALGAPERMDRAADVERAVDARVLEAAAEALEERDAGGFDSARRDAAAGYLRTCARRIRGEAARRLRGEADADGNIPADEPPGWRPPDKLEAPRA